MSNFNVTKVIVQGGIEIPWEKEKGGKNRYFLIDLLNNPPNTSAIIDNKLNALILSEKNGKRFMIVPMTIVIGVGEVSNIELTGGLKIPKFKL